MTTLWTRRDLADYLKVDVRTTYVMEKSGAVPRGLRIGGSLRWEPLAVERWIREKAAEASNHA